MVIYGMLVYLIFLRWPQSRARWWLGGSLILLVLLIGLSRMMLGVHYFSDVLGGYLFGMTWLAVFMAVVERGRVGQKGF